MRAGGDGSRGCVLVAAPLLRVGRNPWEHLSPLADHGAGIDPEARARLVSGGRSCKARRTTEMGVSYVAVACSLDALASLYASRDEAIFHRVLRTRDPRVCHYLAVASRAGRSAEEVLADIFRGHLRTAGGHDYAYALLACALVLGHDLGGFDCAHSRPGMLTARLESLGEGNEAVPMFLDAWPLPGLLLEDYPGCTTLRADEVARLDAATRSTLAHVAGAFDAEDDAISLELLRWLADCYAGAARRGSDLLLVVH